MGYVNFLEGIYYWKCGYSIAMLVYRRVLFLLLIFARRTWLKPQIFVEKRVSCAQEKCQKIFNRWHLIECGRLWGFCLRKFPQRHLGYTPGSPKYKYERVAFINRVYCKGYVGYFLEVSRCWFHFCHSCLRLLDSQSLAKLWYKSPTTSYKWGEIPPIEVGSVHPIDFRPFIGVVYFTPWNF